MRVTISALAGGQALDSVVDVDPWSELNQTDRPACIHCLSRESHPRIGDTMFFIGINTALLGLLIYGLVTAREKIKAGRKEEII